MSIIKNFSNFAAKGRQFINAVKGKDEKILEVELWGWGEDKGINEDEEEAWALIKYIYHNILINDDNWHFFYENFYNIIRCSESFYPEVIKELDSFGVYYKEKGEWIDGSGTVQEHYTVFKNLFHNFSLLAVKEYDSSSIHKIYDRLTHCFLNHQFYVLEDIRERQGRQWEASIMNTAAMYRAEYTGMLAQQGVYAHASNRISPKEVEKAQDKLKEKEC